MSQLRKHLDDAKAEYRGVRYPGDLADELLQPRRRSGIWPYAIGVIAAAALVAVVLLPLRRDSVSNNPRSPQVAISNTNPTTTTTSGTADDEQTQFNPSQVAAVTTSGASDDVSFSLWSDDDDDQSVSFSGASSDMDMSVSAPSFSFSEQDFQTTNDDASSSSTTQTSKESV